MGGVRGAEWQEAQAEVGAAELEEALEMGIWKNWREIRRDAYIAASELVLGYPELDAGMDES